VFTMWREAQARQSLSNFCVPIRHSV
jgi:hypothetical protein